MVKFVKKIFPCEEALENPVPDAPEIPVVSVVSAALVDTDGRVLLAQRPEDKIMSGLWEFPGGKVETGEIPEYALVRELQEELSIETRPCCFSPLGFVSHSYDDFHLVMTLYACRFWKGIPTSSEGQALKWVMPTEIYNYPMPDANQGLLPFVQERL